MVFAKGTRLYVYRREGNESMKRWLLSSYHEKTWLFGATEEQINSLRTELNIELTNALTEQLTAQNDDLRNQLVDLRQAIQMNLTPHLEGEDNMFTYAEFMDGTELTDDELDQLADDSDALDELNCTVGQIAIKGDLGWECKEFTSLFDNDEDGVLQWND